MCETLQLNWKLPSPPVDSMSSPHSVVKTNSPYVKGDRSVSNDEITKRIKTTRFLNNRKYNIKENATAFVGNLNGCKSNEVQESSVKKNRRNKNGKDDGKYILRACSLQKRKETEVKKAQPKKRGPKPRPKPQPMSKYRRKTANLRERERMGEINTAFEHLKEKIPTPLVAAGNGNNSAGEKRNRCEKLTKINVLHVAINYIRALQSILDTGDAGVQVYGTSVVQSPLMSAPASAVESPNVLKEQNTNQEFMNHPHESNKTKGEKQSKDANYQFSCRRYKKRTHNVMGNRNANKNKNRQIKFDAASEPRVRKTKLKKQALFSSNVHEHLNKLEPIKPSNLLIADNKSNENENEAKGEIVYNARNNQPDSSSYCPDWTELTPTLEFLPVASNSPQQPRKPFSDPSNVTLLAFPNSQQTQVVNGSNCNYLPKNPVKTMKDVFPTQGTVPLYNDSNVTIEPITTPKSTKEHNLSSDYQPMDHSLAQSTHSKINDLSVTESSIMSTQNVCSPVAPTRSNLDTLLSVTASNQHEGENQCKNRCSMPHNNLIGSFVQRKTKNMTKPVLSSLNCDVVAKPTTLPWLTNSPSPPIFGRQPSFPDVFGAADDPDFLFSEITKSSLIAEGGSEVGEEMVSSYVLSPLGFCSKSTSISSGVGSILGSDGTSSSDENDVTIMDFLTTPFEVSI